MARASALHAGGHRFESCTAHQDFVRGRSLVWLKAIDCRSIDRGFESHRPRFIYPAGIAQVVERGPEKPGVPSASLGPGTTRRRSSVGRAGLS